MTDERDTESTATVLVAGGANLAIAVAKTAGGLLSGSAAMLAEAAHSVADTFNQVLLLTALRRSRRPPDARHPFGYGQERYFWSLLAGGDIERYADAIEERVRARFPEVRHLFIDPTNAARETTGWGRIGQQRRPGGAPAVSDKPDHDSDTGDESGRDNRSDDRNETPSQRMDRNWDELLQELRVAQTGVQILTGFLLTLPFQQRFEKLTGFQQSLYLVAFVLSSTATVVIVAPVGFHRAMFRRRQKAALVRWADRLARAGLTILAGAVSTVALLVFDVVLNLTVGIIAGVCGLFMFAFLWLVLPIAVRRRNMPSES